MPLLSTLLYSFCCVGGSARAIWCMQATVILFQGTQVCWLYSTFSKTIDSNRQLLCIALSFAEKFANLEDNYYYIFVHRFHERLVNQLMTVLNRPLFTEVIASTCFLPFFARTFEHSLWTVLKPDSSALKIR